MISAEEIIYKSSPDLNTKVDFNTFIISMGWRGWRFDKVSESAAVMIKDNYIHVGCLPDERGKFITRKRIKEVFEPLLWKYGSVRTEVAASMTDSIAFIERLGFKAVDYDFLRNTITYETKEIPYASRTTVHRSSNRSRWSS